MKIVKIGKEFNDIHRVMTLYKEAFPKSERDSFNHLLDKGIKGSDLVAFYEENVFCGFAYLLTYKDITHILYFAIDKNLRQHGYGKQALDVLAEYKKGNKFIVDVERETENAKNLQERINRVNFYLHNGYYETEIKYEWNKVEYEILCNKNTLKIQEFDDFWRHFEYKEDMGKFLYETFKKKL